MRQVLVKPLDVKKWHGKKNEEDFSRAKVIQALVDVNTNRYKTGLTEEEEEKYGKLLGKNLSSLYNPEEPHPFWDSRQGEVRLENVTQILNPDFADHYVKIAVMKASKFVANSYKEWEEGLWPHATHVLLDEEDEVEIKASKLEAKNQAVLEGSKLSKERKIEIVFVISGKLLKGKSDNFVNVAFGELVDKNPEEVLRYIRMNKETMSNHALVLEAIQKNVFMRDGHRILYHDSVLGQDVSEVITYLSDPKNQEFRIRILDLVNKN